MSARAAFIGFGEVASAFAAALAQRGIAVAAYDVLLGAVGVTGAAAGEPAFGVSVIAGPGRR